MDKFNPRGVRIPRTHLLHDSPEYTYSFCLWPFVLSPSVRSVQLGYLKDSNAAAVDTGIS